MGLSISKPKAGARGAAVAKPGEPTTPDRLALPLDQFDSRRKAARRQPGTAAPNAPDNTLWRAQLQRGAALGRASTRRPAARS